MMMLLLLLGQRLLMHFITNELRGIVFTQMELLIDHIGAVIYEILLRIGRLNLILI